MRRVTPYIKKLQAGARVTEVSYVVRPVVDGEADPAAPPFAEFLGALVFALRVPGCVEIERVTKTLSHVGGRVIGTQRKPVWTSGRRLGRAA